jgi:hypothetical protein
LGPDAAPLYGNSIEVDFHDLVSIDRIQPVSHYPDRPIAAEPRGGTNLFLFHSRSSSHTPLLLEFRYVESDFISVEAQLKLVLILLAD